MYNKIDIYIKNINYIIKLSQNNINLLIPQINNTFFHIELNSIFLLIPQINNTNFLENKISNVPTDLYIFRKLTNLLKISLKFQENMENRGRLTHYVEWRKFAYSTDK